MDQKHNTLWELEQSHTHQQTVHEVQPEHEHHMQAEIFACIHTAKVIVGADNHCLKNLVPLLLHYNNISTTYIPKEAFTTPQYNQEKLPRQRHESDEDEEDNKVVQKMVEETAEDKEDEDDEMRRRKKRKKQKTTMKILRKVTLATPAKHVCTQLRQQQPIRASGRRMDHKLKKKKNQDHFSNTNANHHRHWLTKASDDHHCNSQYHKWPLMLPLPQPLPCPESVKPFHEPYQGSTFQYL